MNWLNDLVDEYPTKRSDSALKRLVRVFSDVPDETMQAAVDDYMLSGEKFFPKVADLVPYVETAKEQGRGPEPYSQIRRVKYGRWQSETGKEYSDDDILEWEQERGTLPETDKLGTEWAQSETVGAK